MLLVYAMLVGVGYAAGRVHAVVLRWARSPQPTLVLPTARQVRAARASRMIRGVDVRDLDMPRLGEPPDFWPGGGR